MNLIPVKWFDTTFVVVVVVVNVVVLGGVVSCTNMIETFHIHTEALVQCGATCICLELAVRILQSVRSYKDFRS